MPAWGHRFLAFGAVMLILAIRANDQGLSREGAGAIESVQGLVFIRRGADEFRAAPGGLLFEGDRLHAELDACAVIDLGGHRIRVGPGASMAIAGADARGSLVRLRLWAGRIWLFVRSLIDLDFTIETPAAVAGVRGTVFSVSVAPEGTTWIGVAEGCLAVRAAAGGEEVLLPAGRSLTVGMDGRIGRSERVGRDEVGGMDLKVSDGKGPSGPPGDAGKGGGPGNKQH